MRSASDIVSICDPDGIFIWITPSVTGVLGYRPEQLVGTNGWGLVHPDDLVRVAAFNESLQTDPGIPSPPIELRFRHDDGAWRWIEVVLTPMHHDPNIRGLVVNGRDITDRVEAQAAMRASEERFRSFGAAAPVGILHLDLEGRVTYASDRYLEITGLAREDAHGYCWLETTHPDDRAAVERNASDAVERGDGVSDIVHRSLRPDGTTVWLRGRSAGVPGPDGELSGFTITVEDVTSSLEAWADIDRLAQTLHHTADFVAVVDCDGVLHYANSALRELLGVDRAQRLMTTDLEQLFPQGNLMSLVGDAFPELLEKGSWEGEITFRAADGRDVPVLQSARAHFDEAGELAYISAIGRDISDRKAFEAQLSDRERRFRALAQNASDIVTVSDANARLTYISSSVTSVLGYEPEELIGQPAMQLIHPDDRPMLASTLSSQLVDPGSSAAVLYRTMHRDGSYRYVEAVVSNYVDDPAIGGYVVTARDVHDRHRAELLLADQARILEQVARGGPIDGLLRSVADLVVKWTDCGSSVVVLREGDYLHVAAESHLAPAVVTALEGLYLPEPERTIFAAGASFGEIDLATESRHPVTRQALLDHGLSRAWVAPIREPGQGMRHGSVIAYRGDDSEATAEDRRLLELAANIAGICVQAKLDAQRFAYQARHDPLTDLPNRAQLLEHLEATVDRRVDDQLVVVFFLDLDRFKVFNDSLGHALGDELLVELARRLQAAVRPGDIVARFGGDEFVIACAGLQSVDAAREVAQRLLELVEQPLVSGGSHVVVTASIGIALTAGRAAADALVRDADAAMYEAKERGRAQVVLFDNVLRAKVVARLDIERGLRLAIERSELELRYQPKVTLSDSSLAGFEALVRWNHPTRGLLQPGAFLAVAEETGLVRPMGEWVFEAACRQYVEWRALYPEWGRFRVCINLSVHQLADRNLSACVAGILSRTGADAESIVVEITESALAHDATLVQRSLTELHNLGLSLALDDFGTGYSSLAHLKHFPIDTLKIDGSFIQGMVSDPEDAAIVESIVGLAHALGLGLIAEGVETQEQVDRLRVLDVAVAQGFRWSPPQSVADLERFLNAQDSPIVLPGVDRAASRG